MAWVWAEVEMKFPFRAGPAGAVGGALGTGAVGGAEFQLKVRVETDQECKIKSWEILPNAVTGAGLRIVSGANITQQLRSSDPKRGCKDSAGVRDSWDRLTIGVQWVAEDVVPVPLWTPMTGFVTLPNPFSGQSTIQLMMVIWPNGSGAPSKRVRAWVNNILQFDHT